MNYPDGTVVGDDGSVWNLQDGHRGVMGALCRQKKLTRNIHVPHPIGAALMAAAHGEITRVIDSDMLAEGGVPPSAIDLAPVGCLAFVHTIVFSPPASCAVIGVARLAATFIDQVGDKRVGCQRWDFERLPCIRGRVIYDQETDAYRVQTTAEPGKGT